MDRLQWREPRGYRRAAFREQGRRNPGEAARFAVAAFAIVLGLRGLAALGGGNPNLPGWGATCAVAAAFALFVAYVFPLLVSYVAISTVVLSEQGVNNNVVSHGATLRFWPWHEVDHFRFATYEARGKSYRCLSLVDPEGEVLATFGLAEEPAEAEVERWLLARGIRHAGNEDIRGAARPPVAG